jgi:hypothetical protein
VKHASIFLEEKGGRCQVAYLYHRDDIAAAERYVQARFANSPLKKKIVEAIELLLSVVPEDKLRVSLSSGKKVFK